MDFREFRSGKVWVKVVYGPDPDPADDPRWRRIFGPRDDEEDAPCRS